MRSVISFIVTLVIILFWVFVLNDEIDEMIRRKFDKNHWKKGFWCGLVLFVTWYFSILIASFGTYYIISNRFPYLVQLGDKF